MQYRFHRCFLIGCVFVVMAQEFPPLLCLLNISSGDMANFYAHDNLIMGSAERARLEYEAREREIKMRMQEEMRRAIFQPGPFEPTGIVQMPSERLEREDAMIMTNNSLIGTIPVMYQGPEEESGNVWNKEISDAVSKIENYIFKNE